MLRNLFTLILSLIALNTFSQGRTEWKENYTLTLNDFQAQAPKSQQNGSNSFSLAASLDFGYAMSNYEFMLTKNFNNRVTAYFVPASSWLQQGESNERLLQYAQMQFDLLELHARKYRKRLYESKNALSNYDFYQKANDAISTEYMNAGVEMQDAVLESNAKALEYHQKIKKEIAEMAEFCKECKPVKAKKK
ncbi:hypothetical protein ACFSC6_07840 [Rufibacter sediminis]|uniref:Outer membrane efflux protein n=1 Tax=Rufibacter sediminis TaxID=2762756 RepID=A0ABR6VPX4_9BACT|nr:hypothetical protein [Rufibacter sediminis]MBC3539253.1 hypothetical protein [Rufibacter sediminis]